MAKVTYASLKLKVDNSVETFDFNGNTIEVLKYLPIQDKYDLITMTLERAEEEGVYNPVMMEAYFHLYLVYMYTNLTFTDKQREDELKLYDTLQSSGFITQMLEKISEVEYNTLYTYLEETAEYLIEYKNTLKYFAQNLITDLSSKISNAQTALSEFDEDKYQQIIDIAQSLAGGKEI